MKAMSIQKMTMANAFILDVKRIYVGYWTGLDMELKEMEDNLWGS